MTTETRPTAWWKILLRRQWPWLVLATLLIPAVWHVVDFEEDIDPEFPRVERPTFSRVPPSAYRLAEPGDTLDRIELYLSALAVVMAGAGLAAGRPRGAWPAGFAISLAVLWYSATPGPAVDGWYGLGWRTMFDSQAPWTLRAELLAAALVLGSVIAVSLVRHRRSSAAGLQSEPRRTRGSLDLWIAAAVLAMARQFEIPGVEPVGYWPRWAMIAAILAFDLGLLIELIPRLRSGSRPRLGRWSLAVLGPPAWLGLVILGIAITWYHRPLARMKVVEPGRIYLSAMPTYRGLEVAQERRHFRTIINLFPEETAQRSPILGDELKFVREHNIRYIASPSDPSPAASDAFLSETLAAAQDPSAWPILVHCHGCMDRSPAWMGIYRFLVQGRPLLEIMQEIERHRGYRPKASVILLYNRVLSERARERYASDPTAEVLRQCAAGIVDRPNRQHSRPPAVAATARAADGATEKPALRR